MVPMRFGIVGCGEIAVRTAEGISQAENAEVAMVMDVNEALARDLAERYNVPYTTQLEDVLSSEQVDAVYIATPHNLHAPQAIQCAEAGKHVIVEKPMALNCEEAKAMIDACERCGVALSVCFTMRYLPYIQRAKELVQSEVIGRVIGISIHVLGDKPESYWYGGYTGRAQTDWRMHRDSSGGGILIMNAVHNIDYLRFITGLEVLRVYAEYDTLATSGVDVEDIISVTMRYANGAIGFIEALSCARGSYGPSQWAGDRIFGSDGTLVITQPLRLYTVREDAGFAPHQWVEVTTPPLERSDRALFIEEFVKAVASGQSPPVSGEDGLASIAVIEAAYRSNEEGHAIEPAQLMA